MFFQCWDISLIILFLVNHWRFFSVKLSEFTRKFSNKSNVDIWNTKSNFHSFALINRQEICGLEHKIWPLGTRYKPVYWFNLVSNKWILPRFVSFYLAFSIFEPKPIFSKQIGTNQLVSPVFFWYEQRILSNDAILYLEIMCQIDSK